MIIYYIVVLTLIIFVIRDYLSNNIIENMCNTPKNPGQVIIQGYTGMDINVYHNEEMIGNIKSTETKTFRVKDMSYLDKISIVAKNTDDKGGFCGKIVVNDEEYPLTIVNTKVEGQKIDQKDTLFGEYSGGKEIGCFADNQNNMGALSHTQEGKFTIEQCHSIATANQAPYYGLRKGSKCSYGFEYQNSPRVSDYECNIRCGDTAASVKPIAHYVSNCNQCNKGINWCSHNRVTGPSDISTVYTIGSNLEKWGCDKVSKDTKVIVNQIGGKAHAGGVYVIEPNLSGCDWQCYLNRYPDLSKAYGSHNLDGAKSHYIAYGMNEGRDCGCPKSKSKSFCGGKTSTQVYSTTEVPNIINLQDSERIPRNSKLSGASKWLWLHKNSVKDDFIIGSWKFTWTYIPDKPINFCDNPDYQEFLPYGCSNQDDTSTCSKSNNPNFKGNSKLCKKKNSSILPFKNNTFTYIIQRCINKIESQKKEGVTRDNWEFLKDYSELYKTSCQILKKYGSNGEDLNTICDFDKYEGKWDKKCQDIDLKSRKYPDNIPEKNQCVSPNTIEYEVLKKKCKYNNYCFDKYAHTGPKCYLPNFDDDEIVKFNNYRFEVGINKASLIIENKKENCNLILRWKTQVIDLLKKAKIIDYSNYDKDIWENLFDL